MTIYSTTVQEGIDINNVFYLDAKGAPEYPAAPFLPGELAWGTDGSEWVFGTASISIAPGSAVVWSLPIGSGWSVTLLSSTNGRTLYGAWVGVTGGATGSVTVQAPSGTQTKSYFWVQRQGLCPALLVAGSLSPWSTVATSGTAGQVGTVSAATTALVNGVVFAQIAPTASTGYQAMLNFPVVGIQN